LTRIDELELLAAADGTEAIRISDNHDGVIDLLLSDIMMPGGPDGLQLAGILTTRRPHMKVVLMSGAGYGQSALDRGWLFIAKPFLPAALVSKLHEALGHPLHQRLRVQPPVRTSVSC
jgi:DNA-binding NtrC family response regulator